MVVIMPKNEEPGGTESYNLTKYFTIQTPGIIHKAKLHIRSIPARIASNICTGDMLCR